ncbi:hypothetical protein DVA86_23660 [Streptomyces armeniacus]|uniref:Tat pathway signal sequence domain protein n=1 Tax=Streptomyces armeniacus TaxID=83291 RepID=A0A345XU73_9ACTN|nr:hypothetical protein [Streptomyces armeniacus]AXK35189.1 hypothetical protein DVA86_23660 [Streptomyces armeniacus]
MGDTPGREHEPEVLAAHDAPGLTERWALLPRRLRHAVAAGTVVVAAVAAGSVYAVSQRPDPEPAPPVPYPAQITSITLRKITSDAADDRAFTISLRATTTSASPVTVERVGHGYHSIDLRLDPPPPIVVTSAKPRQLTVRARVTSCTGLPLDASMPYLDVTLRNSRAEQKLSVILGERYARGLSRQLRTLCGLTPAQ